MTNEINMKDLATIRYQGDKPEEGNFVEHRKQFFLPEDTQDFFPPDDPVMGFDPDQDANEERELGVWTHEDWDSYNSP